MSRPLYPWLLSLFPILHLYSANLGQVRDGEVLVSAAVGLALTTVFYLAVYVMSRSPGTSALVTAVFVLFFFSYGHIAAMLNECVLGRGIVLLPGMVVGATVLSVLAWRLAGERDLRQLNKTVNLIVLALLVMPSAEIIMYWVKPEAVRQDIFAVGERPRRSPKILDSRERPDVYYIIPDGYSSNRHLLRDYGYDNSPFTNALEELGFFVAYDSKSNYGGTLHSLSSALNMRYVSENLAAGALGQAKEDMLYLRLLVADSDVARFLMEEGYTYMYMLSGYTVSSTIADLNIDFAPNGPLEYQASNVISGRESFGLREYKRSFSLFLAKTTLLRIMRRELERILLPKDRPFEWSDTRRFFATLERLEAVPDMPEATFTFVHLLKPHEPITLDRNGRELPQPPPGNPTREELFFSQLEYLNERFLASLSTIVRRSKNPPIVIFQADHGSRLGKVRTADDRATYFEIMNAFHLPGKPPARLHSDVAPVNSFRILLSEYFGRELDDLEVRRYDLPKGYDAPFFQVDVTESF